MPTGGGGGSVPPVRIKYEAIDAVSAPLAKMASAQTSLLSTAANLSLVMQGVGMAFRAAQTVMSSTIKLNQEYEQSILTIAGNLSAFDLAPNFENAKKQAVGLFETIQKLAAALPGETEQYVQVFKTVLPQAIDAFAAQGGASLEQMAEFTSKWTAVTVSQGIDAAQSARDLRQMLSGRAGLDVRSFSEMMGFLRRSAKELGIQGDINAKTFNAFDQATRLKILQGTIKAFGPLLGNFSNTADALQGTFTSIAKELGRAATLPLFEVYKEGLIKVSEWANKHKDRLMEIGKVWGGAVADGIRTAVGAMGQLLTLAQQLVPVAQRIGAGISKYAGGLANTYSRSVAPHAALAGQAIGAGTGPGGQAAGGLAAFFPTLTIAATALTTLGSTAGLLDSIMRPLNSVIAAAAPALGPFVSMLVAAGELLGTFAGAILPPLLGAVEMLVKPLAILGTLVFSAVREALDWLTPGLAALGGGVMKVVQGLAAFISPLAQIVALFAGYFVKLVANSIIPLLSKLAEVLGLVLGGLGDMLNWLGRKMDKGLSLQNAIADRKAMDMQKKFSQSAFVNNMASAFTAAQRGVGNHANAGWGILQGAGKSILGQGEAMVGELAKKWLPKDKHPGKTANTVQDFRGSQFTITQQFAEGFDPDRIAAVFGQDVARLGEIRRQSSLAPLYSVR